VAGRLQRDPFQTPESGAVTVLLLDHPTATQTAERHETAAKLSVMAPAGVGKVVSFQPLPSHLSAAAEVAPVALVASPTATQAVGLVHETPLSWAPPGDCAGFGICWTFQVLPFHISANTTLAPVADEGGINLPTARQKLAETHDTPLRTADVVPSGAGLGWMAQDLPFQCSTSPCAPMLERFSPTAVHEAAVAQETALS
jgi:hypothetical protein